MIHEGDVFERDGKVIHVRAILEDGGYEIIEDNAPEEDAVAVDEIKELSDAPAPKKASTTTSSSATTITI